MHHLQYHSTINVTINTTINITINITINTTTISYLHHTTPPPPTPTNTTIPQQQQQRHLFQQTILFNNIKYHSLNKFNTIDNNFTRRVNFLALFSITLSQKQSESAAESFANSTFSSCWKTKYRHAQKVKY